MNSFSQLWTPPTSDLEGEGRPFHQVWSYSWPGPDGVTGKLIQSGRGDSKHFFLSVNLQLWWEQNSEHCKKLWACANCCNTPKTTHLQFFQTEQALQSCPNGSWKSKVKTHRPLLDKMREEKREEEKGTDGKKKTHLKKFLISMSF